MIVDLLCSDVDGTLIDGPAWRAGARDFLRGVAEAGAHVALCSARPSASLTHLAEGLPVDAICAFGGAEIWTRGADDWTLRAEHHLTREQIERGRAVAGGMGLQCWEFYADGSWVVSRESPEVDVEAEVTLLSYTLVDDAAPSAADCRKLLLVGSGAVGADAAVQVQERIGGVRAARSLSYYVEVGPADAPHDKGLAELAVHLGIPRERVAAVGDHDNDRGMLRASGRPFALPPIGLTPEFASCAVLDDDPYAVMLAALTATGR